MGGSSSWQPVPTGAPAPAVRAPGSRAATGKLEDVEMMLRGAGALFEATGVRPGVGATCDRCPRCDPEGADMSLIEWIAVAAAGFGAGAVNTIVGSGSLITYPVMVLLGVPPVTANIANTVGLVPGSLAGAWGYRDRLGGTRPLLLRLGAASLAGAVCGAALLTRLPKSSFAAAVPVLILAAALLVGLQPLIVRRTKPTERTRWRQVTFWVFLTGVYGGYFSAAQGVILLGLLGLFLASGLQQQNAVKNVLQALVNLVAAVFLVVTAGVAWRYAAMVAIGSLVGAPVGAALAKKIPTGPFRAGIVVFGVLMAGVMAWLARR